MTLSKCNKNDFVKYSKDDVQDKFTVFRPGKRPRSDRETSTADTARTISVTNGDEQNLVSKKSMVPTSERHTDGPPGQKREEK